MSDQNGTLARVSEETLWTNQQYTVRPGIEYEIVPGIWLTLNKPTISAAKAFDAIGYRFAKYAEALEKEKKENEVINPEAEAYYIQSLVERVAACCQLPPSIEGAAGLLGLQGVTTTMLKRIVADFQSLK